MNMEDTATISWKKLGNTFHSIGALRATLNLLITFNHVDKHGKDMIERTLKDFERQMADD